MKIGLSITNHNQNDNIKSIIDNITKQTIQPDVIFVCSDDKTFKSDVENVVCINNKKL